MSTVLKNSSVTSTRFRSQGKILVFIDGGVETPQFLADGIIPEATAFILNPSQDGIKQITEILQDYPQVESLHLISHGSPGSIQLGNSYLSLDTLTEYQQDLKHWHSSSLLIYGCNVAAGDAGTELMEKLHQLTGANIAASQTKTGNASLGGDWNLEVTTNSQPATLAFAQSTLAQYLFTFAIERVSVDDSGNQGNSYSFNSSISGDGRYVTFQSDASNLVPGETNNTQDVFVYDRKLNTTERVSVGENGNQGNDDSYESSMSGDGRYVTFSSNASNLVPGDTNSDNDIFVYDRELNTTERVSVGENGTQGNYLSSGSSISGDGRYVSFASYANNLVRDDTNNVADVFIYDRELNTTERVSVGENGTQGNYVSYGSSISGDGRYVSFLSDANNLVPGDTNDTYDVFVYDRELNTTERVSVGENDIQGNGFFYDSSMSRDGRYVSFSSSASNLVPGDTNNIYNVFVHDRELNITERVSFGENSIQGNGSSFDSSMSRDGRYVTFLSFASNLVPGDTNDTKDVFVYDRELNITKRVSVNDSGNEGHGWYRSISEDGRYITFHSDASNLVEGDTNGAEDVFVVENPFIKNPPIVETEIPNQITNNTDAFSLDVSSNFQDADDNDQLSFSARGLPEGLSISLEGVISGQTQANGFYTVGITAEDLSASAQSYFKLTVYESMTGTETDDRLTGNSKLNEMIALEADDTILGFGASDRLFGGDGNDVLRGGTQNDQLFGEAGSDRLFGGYGDDQLIGGTENDRLIGGYGDDQLIGGKGNDLLVGEEGADVFVLQSRHGLDTISDFNVNQDRLQLSTNFTGSLGLSDSNDNTTISIVTEQGEKAIAILQGITDASLASLGLGIK
jgi:archaellum component FlaF (FlaF/FlaG flagellin family)